MIKDKEELGREMFETTFADFFRKRNYTIKSTDVKDLKDVELVCGNIRIGVEIKCRRCDENSYNSMILEKDKFENIKNSSFHPTHIMYVFFFQDGMTRYKLIPLFENNINWIVKRCQSNDFGGAKKDKFVTEISNIDCKLKKIGNYNKKRFLDVFGQ